MFGVRCLASCRWLYVNPHHFSWTVKVLKTLLLTRCFTSGSKHTAIKFHSVREHVDPDEEYGTATLIHVRTKDQTADIFIKFLTGQDIVVHREHSLGELWKDSEAVIADNRRRKV